ncbi:MAG TPA: hypothetical protein VGQ96_01290 [Candidatus Eremiobacteraceae bacterium]|nr:hypothetical protein [Candidatus Eremiobacteraceae bacterium]
MELMRVRGGVSVEEAARELHLTRTTVVNRLKSLMGDGLVKRSGLRRGPRRPSIVYTLTADADRVFPELYEEFASDILHEMAGRRSPQTASVIRGVTNRWIARDTPAVQGLHGRQRVDRALDVLSKKGFMPALDGSGRSMTLQHFNCPLRRLCVDSIDVRNLIRRWIEALFGMPAHRSACICKGAPACRYLLGQHSASR